jgi:hypothetical protein
VRKIRDSEGGGDGHIRGVTTGRHQHTSHALLIMPGVEGPPAIFEIHLKPRAEVHGRRGGRHTDIAQLSCGVASGNIPGATERDSKMLKIPAEAEAFREHVQSRLCWASVLISEANF